MKCIVCKSQDTQKFGLFDCKLYWKCIVCEAKFLDKGALLTAMEEKAHYLHHDNKITDLAYRSFLNRLKTPLCQVLSPGDVGLDYGCGNGPALADMFRQDGFKIDLYDPFFYPNTNTLKKNMILSLALRQ